MNSIECKRIISNFLSKIDYSENWIAISPELPTSEETKLYEYACERLEQIKRIEYETEERIRAKKEAKKKAKEQEMIKIINHFINEVIGGIDNCCDLLETLRNDILRDGKIHIRELKEDNKMNEANDETNNLFKLNLQYKRWKNELQECEIIQSSKEEFVNFINSLHWD